MNSQDTNIAEDILDVIEMAIEKNISKLRDNFIRTTVQEVTSDYKYKVGINGAYYKVISGCGMQFKAGESVWVHIPNGDYTKAYICASSASRYIERETTVNITEQLLANYVRLQYLENNYNTKSEISNTYETKTAVTQALNNYVKSDALPQMLSGFISSTDLEKALQDYTPSDDITALLTGYVTWNSLQNTLTNYVTSLYLSSVLENYVLRTELANYYTKAEADELFEPKATDPEPDPTPSPEQNGGEDSGQNENESTETENNTEENSSGGGE